MIELSEKQLRQLNKASRKGNAGTLIASILAELNQNKVEDISTQANDIDWGRALATSLDGYAKKEDLIQFMQVVAYKRDIEQSIIDMGNLVAALRDALRAVGEKLDNDSVDTGGDSDYKNTILSFV